MNEEAIQNLQQSWIQAYIIAFVQRLSPPL